MTSPKIAIRTGIDIVNIRRIASAIERHGDLFLNRVFTAAEIKYCHNRPNPASSFAARFAAKEAVMKLLGAGIWEVGFTDIDVGQEPSGRPTITISGRAKKIAARHGVQSIDISLAHERTDAVASAVALIVTTSGG